MLDELFKGFKSAKAFIAYGPQLTKIVRFALANPELYLRGHIPRPHPEPQEEQEARPQEEPQQDPRAKEPNLEAPNLEPNLVLPIFEPEDFRVSELNFSAHTQGSGYNPGDGEETSQPKGPGVTIPVNIEGVERGEGQREEQRGEKISYII